jgi:hypothetical protein
MKKILIAALLSAAPAAAQGWTLPRRAGLCDVVLGWAL